MELFFLTPKLYSNYNEAAQKKEKSLEEILALDKLFEVIKKIRNQTKRAVNPNINYLHFK